MKNYPKKEIRILGIDDASFDRFKDRKTKVIGAFFRGGNFLDGVVSTVISIDGDDSTKNLTEMINKSKFKSQLQAVMLNGIAVGGFNVVDIRKLSKQTKLPVIVAVRKYPDFKKIFLALEKIKQRYRDKQRNRNSVNKIMSVNRKIQIIRDAPKPEKIGKIWVQCIGITKEKAADILKITCTNSFIPEPIRAAHLIGQGISLGESRGRA